MARRSRDSGNQTVLIILLVLGGLGLVVILACAGIAYYAFTLVKDVGGAIQAGLEDVQHSRKAAEAFLADVRANRLDAAYQATTDDFRKRMNRQGFDEFVRRNPTFGQATDIEDTDWGPALGKQAAYTEFALKRPGRQNPEYALKLVKEAGAWKVDLVEVDESDKVETVVKSFVDALRARGSAGAYPMTTAGFRQRWNAQRFEQFVRQHPVPPGVQVEVGRDIEDRTRYDAAILKQDGDYLDWSLSLIKENGVWKVDDLLIDEP
jgi:hypothetical protein